jgi:hypothetical protein
MKLFKALIATSVVVLMSVSAMPAHAIALMSGNWTLVNKTGNTANDFRLVVDFDQTVALIPPGPNDFYNDGVFTQKTASKSIPMIVTWKNPVEGPYVQPDGQVHLGFNFSVNKPAAVKVTDAFWTFEGTKLEGEQPKIAGFSFTQQSPGVLTLFNDTGGNLWIDALQYAIVDERVPIDLLMPFTLTGFVDLLEEPLLMTGSQVTFTGLPELLPGQSFLVQFLSYPADDENNVSAVIYQQTIPEPTTLALFGLGLAGLGAIRRKKLAA